MDKAQQVDRVCIDGMSLTMNVDGRPYAIDLAAASPHLARATDAQRANVEVSPSGYGLYWPELDEDLAIDGLIGFNGEYLPRRHKQ